MNYLTRRIRIWYKDRRWAEQTFKKLINAMPEEYILRTKENKNELYAEFLDCSTLRMVPAKDSRRADRASEIYIQSGIDPDTIKTIISSTLLRGGREPRVIENAEDIWNGGMSLTSYFQRGFHEV